MRRTIWFLLWLCRSKSCLDFCTTCVCDRSRMYLKRAAGYVKVTRGLFLSSSLSLNGPLVFTKFTNLSHIFLGLLASSSTSYLSCSFYSSYIVSAYYGYCIPNIWSIWFCNSYSRFSRPYTSTFFCMSLGVSFCTSLWNLCFISRSSSFGSLYTIECLYLCLFLSLCLSLSRFYLRDWPSIYSLCTIIWSI